MHHGTVNPAAGRDSVVGEGVYDGKRGMLVSRTNLLTRLLILVAVATLPAVLVTTYMQQNLREEGRERIASEALRQAELLNADLTSVVEGARNSASRFRILRMFGRGTRHAKPTSPICAAICRATR